MNKKLSIFSILAVVSFYGVAQAKPYNKDYIGEMVTHNAVFEDTLIHLARHNQLGFVELRAANPELDPWIPGAGAKIILPKQNLLPDTIRDQIVINLSEMRLYYFKEQGKAPITYPISVGREGLSTPSGTTTIVRKVDGPTWHPTDRMRKEKPELPASVPPGKDNPLGTHALYLGWPQYLIHGTNKPYGVGRRVSSGCIRMYPESIKDFWPQVPVGTKVTVVDQPIKVGWIEDELFIEVHPNQEQALAIEEDRPLKSYEITADDMKRITKKAGEYADYINWEDVREAVRLHAGYPVAILNKHKKPEIKAAVSAQDTIDRKAVPDTVEVVEVKNIEAVPPVDSVYTQEQKQPVVEQKSSQHKSAEVFEQVVKKKNFNN